MIKVTVVLAKKVRSMYIIWSVKIHTQRIKHNPTAFTFNYCYSVLNIVEYTCFMNATGTLFA
jgi:hypothetical protein